MLKNPKIVVFFFDFSDINVFWQKDALYVDRQMSTKSEKLFLFIIFPISRCFDKRKHYMSTHVDIGNKHIRDQCQQELTCEITHPIGHFEKKNSSSSFSSNKEVFY